MQIVLGLGGNIGDPPAAFEVARAKLAERHRLLATSSLYRSRPIGPSQPRFFNMALLLEIDCTAVGLLEECLALEDAAGRQRGATERWGPRPLDVDLLMAQGLVRRGPRLVLPHPHFAERSFALVPSAELVPKWVHPIMGRTIRELAERARQRDPDAVWKLEE